ncbi:hypothetical protein DAPPUDRAFT_98847 [Daphnia pulex]|uniref:RNA helicase n=1 Tax=Daphnia pulex TaxID=6669 RepID=E9G4J7_DAPPU|nr:hypothetical protein DAPPUDRAFT_98847 [Daphnia pulex]|eukprot:EFX85550.1 hypothetical protein DAPPUDRAFT_98847 [Daphnia pulex]
MLASRVTLPAWSQKEDVLNTVRDNQVVVMCGETGCGKTTQIGQFLLDEAIETGSGSTFHAICTQPRRLAAISVACRVAEERNETCGDSTSSVGYQIRLERLYPRERGSILFCTTGILVQLLISDPLLENYSHILLDEVHERDLLTDFILTIVRDLLPKRPKLRVILMSATINSDLLSTYFNNCPVLNISGRNFPVQVFYLEDILSELDYRFQAPEILIMALLKHIFAREADGAILIFFLGWEQIKSLNKLLLNDRQFSSRKFLIFTLHSMLPTFNQRQVFDKPPRGVRKLILSTNTAETSLTIDDVYVIDCGKAKLPNFDPQTKLNTLNSEWITLANEFAINYTAVDRTRLEELILRVKILKLGWVEDFLRKVPEPPDDCTVKISLELLHELGALDDAECLTAVSVIPKSVSSEL